MKRILLFFLALVAALTVWSCKKDKHSDSQLERRTFTSTALQNNVIGDPAVRGVMVYLPPDYDANRNKGYPVVYLLHPVPFGDSVFIDKHQWDMLVNPDGLIKTYPDFPANGFRAWVDGMIDAKKIEEMIIVMPDARTSYGFSFYSNSALLGNYETYIANDLVNFIDDTYNTLRGPEGRSVVGVSQGGYGAMKMGLFHADVFGAVAVHSSPLVFEQIKGFMPYVIAENPEGMTGPSPTKFNTTLIYGMAAAWSPNLQNPPFFVDLPFTWPSPDVLPDVWDRWLQHDPITLLPNHVADLQSLRGLYIDVGNQDEFFFNLSLPYFGQTLAALNVPHTFQTYEGGHFDKMFSRLEVSLAFCSTKMNH